jgi:hypothetical protein
MKKNVMTQSKQPKRLLALPLAALIFAGSGVLMSGSASALPKVLVPLTSWQVEHNSVPRDWNIPAWAYQRAKELGLRVVSLPRSEGIWTYEPLPKPAPKPKPKPKPVPQPQPEPEIVPA